ncbi:unnamed protein product, partial [marine sediment metagenome]
MEFFDKILGTFSKKIDYVRRASMGVPKTFVINLAVPLTDQRYDISGNIYYIWSSPKATDYVDIKVNKTSEPALRCVRQTGLITPFDKLLITTPPGQAGEMVILYGTEAPELLTLIDNRSATLADTAAILNELQGDVLPENWNEATIGVAQAQVLAANADRKSFTIQAESTNTGIVYIGFDATV